MRARQLLFAVDQQAYLQGYLPIVLLTQRARYGLFPAQGDVLPTGPNFVTARERGQGDRAAASARSASDARGGAAQPRLSTHTSSGSPPKPASANERTT